MCACLSLGLWTTWLAALAWGCVSTAPVLGDTPSPPSLDASILDAPNESEARVDASCTGDASGCSDDLSNIGTADFRISLTLTTTQQGWVAIVNQRPVCNAGMFWDIRMDDGHIVAETDDGMYDGGVWIEDPRTTLTSSITANDGVPHCILVQRVDDVLSITIDGLLVGEATSISSLAALAPLAAGTDPCDCAGPLCVPPEMALIGTVAGLCVEGAERLDE